MISCYKIRFISVKLQLVNECLINGIADSNRLFETNHDHIHEIKKTVLGANRSLDVHAFKFRDVFSSSKIASLNSAHASQP